MSKTLLVMAGGTGGHVFPGLAVAHELRQLGWQVHWLGTADRMEAQLVPSHGYPIHFIDIQGVRGNGVKRLLAAPFRILKAVWQASRVIRRLQPDLVMGMGGFAAGPGGLAAWLCGKPLLIHEQNAAAGLTNRLLARLSRLVLQGFAGAFPESAKTLVVGNPVRAEVMAVGATRDYQPVQDRPLRVLILGGSLGARPLNERVPGALASLPVAIRHQAGRGHAEAVRAAYEQVGRRDVRVSEFIQDMAEAYAWADLVICRAGALTVAELAAAGLPAIFVPLPHAVDDHQTHNARSLTERGAAVLMPQATLSAKTLAAQLRQWDENRAQLTQMGRLAREAAILDATARVSSICRQVAGESNRIER